MLGTPALGSAPKAAVLSIRSHRLVPLTRVVTRTAGVARRRAPAVLGTAVATGAPPKVAVDGLRMHYANLCPGPPSKAVVCIETALCRSRVWSPGLRAPQEDVPLPF